MAGPVLSASQGGPFYMTWCCGDGSNLCPEICRPKNHPLSRTCTDCMSVPLRVQAMGQGPVQGLLQVRQTRSCCRSVSCMTGRWQGLYRSGHQSTECRMQTASTCVCEVGSRGYTEVQMEVVHTPQPAHAHPRSPATEACATVWVTRVAGFATAVSNISWQWAVSAASLPR